VAPCMRRQQGICLKRNYTWSMLFSLVFKTHFGISLCTSYLLMWHYNQCLHVEENLSMSACLAHSASNLWPLGPGYRCSPHPPIWISVFLDFSFHWVWLWIEFFGVGLRVFWSRDQRSAICLSSWHLGHPGCQTLLSSS
jgi:hypothetical protein